MNTFEEAFTADLRLAMLRTLNQAPGCKVNDSMLQSALDELGQVHSRDRIRTEIAWLDEQGLVESRNIMDGAVITVELTGRGTDVATGRATVPGVKRPRPGK